jgi:polysaccharide biosynthesis transport protein
MHFKQLPYLISRNKWLLAGFPLTLAVVVFVFTMHMKREYTSSTLIYTGLVSGYTLETGENSRMDYLAVNNAFDNLINTARARATVEEVGVRILAQHLLMTGENAKYANQETLNALNRVIPSELKTRLVAEDVEQTVQNIYAEYDQEEKPVVDLLTDKNGIYSEIGISSRLKASRMGTSDMIELKYTAQDPGVALQTLKILTDIFLGRYRKIKVEETGSVVAYFEEQLKKALEKLRGGEERLKTFATENRIINYYEQTKYISAQQRDIELEIHEEKSSLAAAQAAFQELDEKLAIRKDIALKSSQINQLRDSLSHVSSRLTMLQVDEAADPAKLANLRRQATLMEDKLKQDIALLYNANNTKEGIPSKALFEEWINSLISIDKSKARLKVMEQVRKDYQRFYDKFAPLGSGLNRLEREVGVAEREYLEILHSLNMSKLRERNLEFSSKLRIIDPPVFPLKPEPSKRLLLVVASFLVGLMLCSGYVVAKEYFDTTVRNPERASRLTGLSFAGALPLYHKRYRRVNYAQLEKKLLNFCAGKINFNLPAGPVQAPRFIVLFSIRNDEGKTYLGHRLADRLNRSGSPTLLCEPLNRLKPFHESTLPYKLPANFSSVTSLQELTNRTLNSYHYVILEIPSIINHPLPVELIQKADLSLLLLEAGRKWEEADAFSLARYKEIARNPVMLLLNKVEPDQLAGVVGKVST